MPVLECVAGNIWSAFNFSVQAAAWWIASDCTQRQNGVNTRKRGSPCYGSGSEPRGGRRGNARLQCRSRRAPWRPDRRSPDTAPCAISFSTPHRPRSRRAIPAMTSAAAPLRSTSDAPKRLQARLQGAERLRQPPTRRAARTARARGSLISTLKTDHRPAGPGGGIEAGWSTGGDRRETRRWGGCVIARQFH